MNTLDLTSLEPEKTESSPSTWRDWVGITASIGCAIHCAAMPFVIAYLPALGLSFLADEAFHKWMALVCFLIAIAAFVPGLRKHGNWIPVSVGAFGLAFITFAAFGLAGECCPSCAAVETSTSDLAVAAACDCEDCQTNDSVLNNENPESDESTLALASEPTQKKDLLSTLAPWITPFGGLLLVCAHLMNRSYGCACSCCGTESVAPTV